MIKKCEFMVGADSIWVQLEPNIYHHPFPLRWCLPIILMENLVIWLHWTVRRVNKGWIRGDHMAHSSLINWFDSVGISSHLMSSLTSLEQRHKSDTATHRCRAFHLLANKVLIDWLSEHTKAVYGKYKTRNEGLFIALLWPLGKCLSPQPNRRSYRRPLYGL